MIRTRATKVASWAQQRYMTSFDKTIRRIQGFEEGDLVSLDINLSFTSEKADDPLQKLRAKETDHTKLLPYSQRPSLWKQTESWTPSELTECKSPNINTKAKHLPDHPNPTTKYRL